MGYTQALGFADAVRDGDIGLADAVRWHLSANHYPPVPAVMVDPCIEAIRLADAGEWDAEVELPAGVEWRGRTSAPVSAIVEQHHLDAFLASDNEEG